MKFPKLHLVCAHDELRPTMECICVGKEYTYASDGHVLVRHNTTEIFKYDFTSSLPDESIMIHRKAIFLMCQKATEMVSLSSDKTKFQLHRLDSSIITYKLYTGGKYVNAESVIPNLKDIKPLKKIGLSALLMSRLADGLGCDIPILHLSFITDHTAVYATSPHTDYSGAIGIIMPTILTH